MLNTVTPHNIIINGLYNIFTGRKKYGIECGYCLHTYNDKLPLKLSDRATSICPACKIINVWSHKKAANYFDKITKHDDDLIRDELSRMNK